ncbi:MAG TPA: ABC transporter ATP-binding protein [Candidatus Krumholzibacteria bacterium]|nr:ABC transporter ATP-binding protein [Candidatus Krumholzibacteria bacterium]
MDGCAIKVNRTETSLKVDGLSFAYARDPVLKDVSFTLQKSAVGLLGPNGSGKTTLLRCLLGQVPLVRGQVTVLGHDMAVQARLARAGLGWMPERGGIIPGFSGVGLVAYLGELSGMPGRDAMQRAHEVLHYVGLADERYRPCDTYSQGMKQRLKLAQTLVHDPDWIFLDEPTSGLDPRGRVSILELIEDLAHRKGLGVILSTHLLADVEAVCDEILVLRQGELLARRSLGEAARQPLQMFEVEGFGDTAAFRAGLEGLGATIEEEMRLLLVTLDMRRIAGEAGEGGAWQAAAGVNAVLGVALQTGFALRRLRRRPVSLAEEFYSMVEG